MTNIFNFFKAPSQLKQDSNDAMFGYKATAIGGTLVYWLFFLALGGAMFINILWFRLALAGVMVLIFPPLTLGLCKFALNTVGNEPAKISNIFFGFKHFFKAFIIFWLCFFKILFFTIFLVVPGIKKTMGLSMCYYILAENPKIKVNDIIKRSETLMKNHEWRLLKLIFSFAGSFVLGLLSAGIYLLFLTPQFNGSIALFYQDIK